MNRKTSVLVVDDDVNICELIRLYLEKEGFEVL
ncbi:MAG TPA: DNA-binding response regulator, partial [Clostridiales bacterium]|nr:DNA-binding response regulator [Clostridiales bacterium]